MNAILVRVSKIQRSNALSLVSFTMDEQLLEMISLGLNAEIKEGTNVILGVKATSITLAKNLAGELSTSNQLPCRVKSVDNGELLASIELEVGESILESVITKEASVLMCLEKGDEVLALIKASDLFILEVTS